MIGLVGNYIAQPESDILGFTGENNGRTITFNGLGVSGASSYYFITYNGDREVVELPITNGTVTIPSSIVSVSNTIPCQVVARGDNNFVLKTNTFWLKVGHSVGDVTPEGRPYIDYNDLLNKPQINGHTLVGNKTSEELDINSGGTGERVNARILTDTLLGYIVDAHSEDAPV